MSLERAITEASNGAGIATEPEPAPEAGYVKPAAADSIVGALRTRYAQLRADNTVDLAIPGYSEALWARYHAVNVATRYTDRNGNLKNSGDWRLAADALGSALDGLYGRNERGELEPLFTDMPARFDVDLVDALGLHVTEHTARAVMRELFGGGEKAEVRIMVQFGEYQQWLGATGEDEAVADALGELHRPTP